MDKHNIEEQRNGNRIVGNLNLNGVNTFGVTKEDTQEYAPKTPREQQKEYSVRGNAGASKTEKQYAQNSLFFFKDLSSIDSLRWITITYSHASNDAIIKIAKNWKKVKDALRLLLKRNYSMLWVVSIGLQEKTSHKKLIPCYDINIAIIDKDEKVRKHIIQRFYKSLSKIAGEPIPVPLDIYDEPFKNVEENFKKAANYFSSQVKEYLLSKLRKKYSDEYFPKSWVMLPDDLKRMCKPTRIELEGDNLKQVENFINEQLRGVVKILTKLSNKQKLVTETDLLQCSQDELRALFLRLWNKNK